MSSIDIDELAKKIASGSRTQEALFGENGVLKELIQKTLQAALNGEITDHLGYSKHAKSGSVNTRNGYSQKKIKSTQGDLLINVPRDRESEFEPQIIKKHQTRFDGFDDKIISMYARGLSVEDIKAQLLELYGTEVSTSFISTVTASILDEVKTWQSRPLDPVYSILYLDCIVVKVRHDNQIINKAVYLALGVNMEGKKELLGMWISKNEGAKFWLMILTELKNRGVQDILIACVDGLTGFPEAINTVYPKTQVQLCIVHMLRNSLKFVSYKDRKEVVKDLKLIYTATTEESGLLALEKFGEKWNNKYGYIYQSWMAKWDTITPFFSYPPEIKKAIYTTNAIESMNMTLRKVIKNKRVFPNDDSVFKLLYLAINNISKKWTMPIRNWSAAINHFNITFNGRFIL